MEAVVDKAGEKYWSQVWDNTALQSAIDINSKKLNNTINLRFNEVFKEALSRYETKGKSFLEVGCGNSVWLPYFAKEFGFNVTGLDYSEQGCSQARAILNRDGVIGEIICGDMFNPPESLIGKFDYVISLGVVEHFSDTTATITSLSKFLKPGGIIITTIPNLSGATGFLQKVFNKPVFDIHVVMNKNDLNNAIDKANLNLVYTRYVASISLNINLDTKEKPVSFLGFKKIIAKGFIVITLMVWQLEKIFGQLPKTRFFSPAIISVAKKK